MGYTLEDPTKPREFSNRDLWDTLNEPAVKAIYDGTMSQEDINKHLLTGILTVNCRVNGLYRELYQKSVIGGGKKTRKSKSKRTRKHRRAFL